MKIPVFVSCPTDLNPEQNNSRDKIMAELNVLQLEPRSLGRADYPTDLPLKEILVLANHCSGGIILGFSQFYADSGIWKAGAGQDKEKEINHQIVFPTPWNHIEAGILFGLKLPILIFREDGIEGGIFDKGITDVYIHKMPVPRLTARNRDALRQVFLKWSAKVREHYYRQ